MRFQPPPNVSARDFVRNHERFAMLIESSNRQVGDLVRTSGWTDHVEVDQSRSATIPKNDILRSDIKVAISVGASAIEAGIRVMSGCRSPCAPEQRHHSTPRGTA
jgi:hypothetical protein